MIFWLEWKINLNVFFLFCFIFMMESYITARLITIFRQRYSKHFIFLPLRLGSPDMKKQWRMNMIWPADVKHKLHLGEILLYGFQWVDAGKRDTSLLVQFSRCPVRPVWQGADSCWGPTINILSNIKTSRLISYFLLLNFLFNHHL